ncbi:MAG: porin family protein [Bacteroidia bacterium]|nr:porin family protein [Bacteroidia bacterium]
MKKYIITCLLFVSVLAAHSQDEAHSKLRLSLVVSPQVSWMKPDISDVVYDGLRLGFKFGLNVDYFFTGNYSFSTGLLINNLGGILRYKTPVKFIVSDSTYYFQNDAQVTYKLQYIEVPLLIKLKTNQIGYYTWYGVFGLNPMFNIRARGDADQLSVSDANISKEVNFFNMGYSIGGGAEYAIGNKLSISGGIVFSNGFTDVTTNISGRKNDRTVLNSITFQIGFLF